MAGFREVPKPSPVFVKEAPLSIYFEFAKKAFKQRLAYRASAYLGMVGRFLLLFVEVNVWTALFRHRATVDGVALSDMVTYVIMSMAVGSLTRSSMDYRIAEKVADGSIVTDFVKPVRFKFYVIAEDIGENCFLTLFTTIPVCLFGAWYWGFRIPDASSALVLFAVALLGGCAVIYQLNYVLGLLSFWFQTSYHVDWLFGAFRTLFSGAIVPLWFYPSFLRAVSEGLPWQLVAFGPISIFLEKASRMQAFRVILLQGIWLAVLFGIEQVLWHRAQRKIEIYGG